MPERWPQIRRVKSLEGNMLSAIPGCVGQGGNSGFQALDLVRQFGANPIILTGFDMGVTHGTHWHGDHGHGLNNPRADLCAQWRDAFASAAADLAGQGVRVVNCTRRTVLLCFERAALEDIL